MGCASHLKSEPNAGIHDKTKPTAGAMKHVDKYSGHPAVLKSSSAACRYNLIQANLDHVRDMLLDPGSIA